VLSGALHVVPVPGLFSGQQNQEPPVQMQSGEPWKLHSVPCGAEQLVPAVGASGGQSGLPQIHCPPVQVQFGPG
jgi:hypothetical protein